MAENCLVDVIILGDGFISPSDFRDALADWLNDFFALKIYDVFAGAFRIRALFTRSMPASEDRESYYGCRVNDEATDIWLDDRVVVRRRRPRAGGFGIGSGPRSTRSLTSTLAVTRPAFSWAATSRSATASETRIGT